jgi:hypothetical protein
MNHAHAYCTQLGHCCWRHSLICSHLSLLARTDTTQQTNICLGIHCQTCVVTFNPKCLSRLLTTYIPPVFCLLIVRDVNGTWCTRLMMTRTYICWLVETYALSRRTEGGGGCIRFGNQARMESSLNSASWFRMDHYIGGKTEDQVSDVLWS